jgi:VanZ family protein
MKIRIITYAYLLVLLAGSVVPLGKDSSILNDNYTLSIRWDYLLHAIVYLPLPVLLGWSLGKGFRNPGLKKDTRLSPRQPDSQESDFRRAGKIQLWIPVILSAILIGALLELLQLAIPYRAFNINDLVANEVGTTLGFLLLLVFVKKI